MPHEQRNIPAAALRCTVGPCELGQAQAPDAKTVPIKMLARTGQPIDHWYWGRIVHDLSGMHLHKPRLCIDYCHEEDELIGYLDRFETGSGDLVASGELVPYQENDRASEIIFKAQNGVPYEASIDFGGTGIKIEDLGENHSAEVNGYTFEGPGVIVREWPLRGVAVCPYGADQETSSKLSRDREIPVTVFSQKDPTMSIADKQKQEAAEKLAAEKAKKEAADKLAADKLAADNLAAEKLAAEKLAAEKLEQEAGTPPAPTGQDFLDAYGDKGGVWFAQGKTFEEAGQLHVEQLAAEVATLKNDNAALQARIDAADLGADESEAAEFQDAEDGPADARSKQLALAIGPNLARVAAGMKLSNGTPA